MGSNLIVNTSNNGTTHSGLPDKDTSYQHVLESVYRKNDGVPLNKILENIESDTRELSCELVEITSSTQIVSITKFVYNEVKDNLLVFLCGLQVYEGSDKDYIKTSSSTIQFNYELRKGYEVLVILAGTISGKTYGDSVYNNLSRFTQLVDTIDAYYGNENKFLMVNNQGTGIVACTVKASHDLFILQHTTYITNTHSSQFPFSKSCYITGIKVSQQNSEIIDFEVELFNSTGDYVYASGPVSGVLWDIMKIPFFEIDELLILKITNKGNEGNFKFQLYYEL